MLVKKMIAATAAVAFVAAPALAQPSSSTSKLSVSANAVAPIAGAMQEGEGSGEGAGVSRWIIVGGAVVAVTVGIILATKNDDDKAASS